MQAPSKAVLEQLAEIIGRADTPDKDQVLRQIAALMDAVPSTEDGAAVAKSDLAGKVHAYLAEVYPADTLDWVRDAVWTFNDAVPLADIDMDRRPGGRDQKKVVGIAQAIADGKAMDPVVLVDTGDEDGLQVADGYHRTLAYRHAERRTIAAYVATGVGEHGPWDREMHDRKLNKIGPHGYSHGWIHAGTASTAHEPNPVGDSKRLLSAFRGGHTVEQHLSGGQHADSVQKVRLSDGTSAILKHSDPDAREDEDEVENDHLGGLVAGALGIQGVTVARPDADTILALHVPGKTGIEQRTAAGEVDAAGATLGTTELQRITTLHNGRQIGLLDFITNNLDRHDGNYLVDGNTVRPIDHGSSAFRSLDSGSDGEEMYSPFARAHLHSEHDVVDGNETGANVPASELVSPFTPAELAQFRTSLTTLAPTFSASGATAKYEYMLGQLAKVERAATQ